ncbi:MAG: glycosyltransferase family 2 protein [Acidobacteriota bacterium]|nr:glycosyltransferase family 2 protein [Acidobacteriota bacterium]MDH3524613.1 glycosyltransferase family 2 protein [Acidobacteriota bacterium]
MRAERPTIEQLRRAPGRKPVSVIITTFNEEVNIGECIESVLWADEILVVDSFSTDRTVEIARTYPVKLLQREYFGSAAQKNWSLDRVAHDWVMILDADERVQQQLAAEILRLLAGEPKALGYYVRRRNIVFDREIKHSGWSTDKVIRLFHRAHGRYPNRRVHADVDIEGDVPILKHTLRHYTYRSLQQYIEKLMNYAEWGAAQAFREGRRAGLVELGIRPLYRFLRTYVLQLGFLDGLHGIVVCGLQAYGTFLKYVMLWDYRVRERKGEELNLPAFDEDEKTWERPG